MRRLIATVAACVAAWAALGHNTNECDWDTHQPPHNAEQAKTATSDGCSADCHRHPPPPPTPEPATPEPPASETGTVRVIAIDSNGRLETDPEICGGNATAAREKVRETAALGLMQGVRLRLTYDGGGGWCTVTHARAIGR